MPSASSALPKAGSAGSGGGSGIVGLVSAGEAGTQSDPRADHMSMSELQRGPRVSDPGVFFPDVPLSGTSESGRASRVAQQGSDRRGQLPFVPGAVEGTGLSRPYAVRDLSDVRGDHG